jgi:uncharacterized protein YbaP (TraB family)
MRFLVAAVLLIGCKDAKPDDKKQAAPPAPQLNEKAVNDPWATTTKVDPDALPSLAERVTLADEACPAVTGPFFFEIQKNGKTSHILGTRHISVGLAKFPAVVGDTLDHASHAVFEIAPDDHGEGKHVEEPIKEQLGPKDWAHFEELIGAQMAANFENAEPDAAALSMLVLYEDLTNTLETQLQARARDHQIPMSGLETSKFQDGVLAKLLDLRMLRASIEQTKDRAELKKDSHDDLAQYCKGTDDSPGMDDEERGKMMKAGYTAAELAEMDEVLVYKRNADWIPKLSKLFQDDQVFVAVGADHLIGPRGVIELLKKEGFSVTRITK